MAGRDEGRAGKVDGAVSVKGTVVYVSSDAVNRQGMPDAFMLQELPWLQARFDHVLLVSYYGTADLTETGSEGLRRIPVKGSRAAVWQAWFRAPFAPEFWRELFRLVRNRRLTPRNCLKLLLFTIRGHKLHLWLEKLLHTRDLSHTTLYAFWMSYEAYAAALSKRKHPELRFVGRGHAFDIDEERNPLNPYLMKRFIAEAADELYLISRYAAEQYLRYMGGQGAEAKTRVAGLGSAGEPMEGCKDPPAFAGGTLRVVSCAAISEIKQVPLWIDALALWEGTRLHWLHLGGGPDEEAVRAYAAQRLTGHERVSYTFAGRISHEDVLKTYEEQAFDLFVNTSRLEGGPVSIMEAMRAGIPVLAPRVGGIPEMVDEDVGLLYEPEGGAEAVWKALREFAALPREKVTEMRQNAQKRWRERYWLEMQLRLLFPHGEAKQSKNGEARV